MAGYREGPPLKQRGFFGGRFAVIGPVPPQMRPRGGVVTQRTANPRTPVQFRAWPPFFRKSSCGIKCLLTVQDHDGLVFLEDTPPLPNALGPGSHPASFFCAMAANARGIAWA